MVVFVYDRFIQKTHTIQKNFPVIGHLRYVLEEMGGPLRQYWFSNNREEKPFNRVQRSYIYASAKKENNMQGFGSDADFSKDGHFFIKHSAFPFRVTENHINHTEKDFAPCAKIVGEYNKRSKPFHPKSIVNISAMSYGALGSGATTANNKGAALSGCYHNTGEGGFSQYHDNGADVVFQIGTAYYGCRDEKGDFSMIELMKLVRRYPKIRMIEIKLSQGAKPGKGGILPAEKVTQEIADIRKIKVGEASVSPGYHSVFSNTKELVLFIEDIAKCTGLPVGIKSAVGENKFWYDLSFYMREYNCGPDFITIDGGEGGTGAAPAAFADNVSLPFEMAFTTVYKIMKRAELNNRIVFIGSAKLGLPAEAIKAFALGVDMINMAREILISGGCIQAQKCHTNNCPALVATNKKQHLYNVEDKSKRIASFVSTLRKDILEITHACGYEHPCQIMTSDIDINTKNSNTPIPLSSVYEYEKSPVSFATMDYLKERFMRENVFKIQVESVRKEADKRDNFKHN
jgi:glutamate synthase domain-containing protein 2